MGVVVNVKMEVRLTNNSKRVPMKMACRIPSFVIVKNPHCHSASPGVMNICSATVSSTIKAMALIPRKKNLSGIFEIRMTTTDNSSIAPNPQKLFTTNSAIIYNNTAKILVRGSSLCKKELPGKYCPMVISFSILPSPLSLTRHAKFHLLFHEALSNQSARLVLLLLIPTKALSMSELLHR